MNNLIDKLDLDLTHTVVESWFGGFKSELSFTAGTDSVAGWQIELDADFDIRGIWGAQVISRQGNRIVLGAEDYNSYVADGQEIKITIVADTDPGESSEVENLALYAQDSGSEADELVVNSGTGNEVNVRHNVVENWFGGFKSELVFTPGEDGVEDWRIELDADFDIRGIWGAQVVSRQGDRITLAPEDYNYNVGAGQQVKITIVADTDPGETSNVGNLTFYELDSNAEEDSNLVSPREDDGSSVSEGNTNNKVDAGDGFVVSHNVVENWFGGFKSELSFTPEETSLEDWRIELDADFDIRGIYGAEIVSRNGDRFVLAPERYNSSVAAGEQITITIVADTDPGESSAVENLTLYEFDSDSSNDTNLGDRDQNNESDVADDNPPDTIGEVDSSENVSISHNVVENWFGGFKSELSFTPEETSLDDWRIELDADFDIRGIYGAEVASHDGDRFVLAPEYYNYNVAAGEQITITIVADTDPGESSDVESLTFYSNQETSVFIDSEPLVSSETPSGRETPSDPIVNSDTPTTPTATTGNGSGQFRYGEVVQKSFLFYEAQRSGELPDDNRIAWRGDSSLNDGSDVGLDLTGGYHDAGDHVKFGLPLATSMTTLAWGGVEYEAAYKRLGQWDELLDAVKWGTDWILKAHVNPNGRTQDVYVQVGAGKFDHQIWAPAEVTTAWRPSYKVDRNNPGTEVAADYAASLASASIIFRNENQAYANRLVNEAKQLYEFAENNLGRYSDSVADVNPQYTSYSGYEDELIWGASWLYRATGEQQYLNKARQYADRFGIYPGNTTLSWDDKTAGALVLLAQTGDQRYVNTAKNWLDSWMPGGGTATYTNGGFAWNGRWGSLRTTANTAFLASVFHETVENNSRYRNFAETQIDYILGDNPRNSSYVVGFGNNSPQRAHHRSASGASFNNVNFRDTRPNEHIIYGALVGGPQSPNDFDWQDDRGDAIGNEIALDYNAAFTGAVTYLYDQYGGDALSDQELDLLPGIDITGV